MWKWTDIQLRGNKLNINMELNWTWWKYMQIYGNFGANFCQ